MKLKKVYDVLGYTARALLILLPLMLISGFLTAKPYLLEALDFSTARMLHTLAVPLLFVPLIAIHSTAGVLVILSKNKTIKQKPALKKGLTIAWLVLLTLLATTYFLGRQESDPASIPGLDISLDAGAGSGDADAGDAAAAPRRDAEVMASADAEVALDARRSFADGDIEADAEVDGDLEAEEPQPAKTRPPRRQRRPQKRRPSSETSKTQAESADSGESPGGGDEEEPQPEAPSGAQLVKQRCTSCHGLNKVYSTNRSPSEWRSILGRMLGMGANLDQQERGIVLRHLVSRAGRPEDESGD